jgi:hypothetical protein
MPAEQKGSIYKTKRRGFGVRWLENGKRLQQSGFRSRTDARNYFRDEVRPRLDTASTVRTASPSSRAATHAARSGYTARHNARGVACRCPGWRWTRSQRSRRGSTRPSRSGIGLFELARYMGTSVEMLDRVYGHLVVGAEQAARAKLDAAAGRSGV